MHVFIYSHSPITPSGYGQQTAQLAKRLFNDGYEVSVVAIDYYSSPLIIDGIKILPTRPNIAQSYNDLNYWIRKERPDKIIQLFDSWVIGHPWIDTYVPVYTYNPVDCLDLPRNFKHSCKGSSLHIAMSPHAHSLFIKNKLTPNIYIPHSVDTSFFQPNSTPKEGVGFPPGSFVFGIIGTNLTARKNIPGQLLAFSNFLKQTKAKDAFLYLHTNSFEALPTSYDIGYLIKSLNLTNKVAIPKQSKYIVNDFPNSRILDIYNSIDVLLMCSLGEGFGVPIIEAQACGVPVIGTNFSAIPHTIGKGGILIKSYNLFCDSGHMGWWAIPDTNEITAAMIRIYSDKNLRLSLKEEAIKNAKLYDWSIWYPKWVEILNA